MKYPYIKSKMNILKKIMIITQFVLLFNKALAVMKTTADLKSGGFNSIETNNGEVCIIPPIESPIVMNHYKKKDKEKINEHEELMDKLSGPSLWANTYKIRIPVAWPRGPSA